MVWYELYLTPQTIPEELLDMIPPIRAALREAGSGPILFWYGDK